MQGHGDDQIDRVKAQVRVVGEARGERRRERLMTGVLEGVDDGAHGPVEAGGTGDGRKVGWTVIAAAGEPVQAHGPARLAEGPGIPRHGVPARTADGPVRRAREDLMASDAARRDQERDGGVEQGGGRWFSEPRLPFRCGRRYPRAGRGSRTRAYPA